MTETLHKKNGYSIEYKSSDREVVNAVYKDGEKISETVDRGRISSNTVDSLKTAVNNINDKPTREAVGEVVEILTGENILEE